MCLYKHTQTGQYFLFKKNYKTASSYYDLDENFELIPYIGINGKQATNVDNSLTWMVSVLRDDKMEKVNKLPEKILNQILDFKPDFEDGLMADDDCFKIKTDFYLLEIDNVALDLKVNYRRVFEIKTYIDEPPEEITTDSFCEIQLNAINVGDCENLKVSIDQYMRIKKSLEDKTIIK